MTITAEQIATEHGLTTQQVTDFAAQLAALLDPTQPITEDTVTAAVHALRAADERRVDRAANDLAYRKALASALAAVTYPTFRADALRMDRDGVVWTEGPAGMFTNPTGDRKTLAALTAERGPLTRLTVA